MKNADEIKQEVKETYSQAVRGESNTSCCGSSSATDRMKGHLVKLAGYSEEELNALPREAVENAFGCGNPLAFMDVKEGDVVLDIGSGAGIDCLLAAERVGETGKVIGLDMTPAMIEKARENARRAGVGNVEFRLGDAETMPVEEASVDWIISNCVINLSPDKDAVFREAHRVLKPGGRLSISDIVAEDLPAELLAIGRLYSACVTGAISERAYLEKIRSAGFTEVTIVSRFAYDESAICGLIESEFGKGLTSDALKALSKLYKNRLAGKISSIKVTAVKA